MVQPYWAVAGAVAAVAGVAAAGAFAVGLGQEAYERYGADGIREGYLTARPNFGGLPHCPICLNAYPAPAVIGNPGGIVSLPCHGTHRFHRGCIAQFANALGFLRCPLCNAVHGPWPHSDRGNIVAAAARRVGPNLHAAVDFAARVANPGLADFFDDH